MLLKTNLCSLKKATSSLTYPTYSLALLKHCQVHPLQLLLFHQNKKAFPQLQEIAFYFYAWTLICCVSFLTCTGLTLVKLIILLHTTSLITLNLLCAKHLPNWQGVELLPSPFLQAVKRNFPSFLIYPAFSLLLIIFVLTISNLSTPKLLSKLLVSLLNPN